MYKDDNFKGSQSEIHNRLIHSQTQLTVVVHSIKQINLNNQLSILYAFYLFKY